MVEINNQRKAFLDILLAWSEGTDNGRQKTRNHGYDVIYGRLFYWLLRSPHHCHAKPKTQIKQAPDAASFRWWDTYRKQLGLKDFSPKSQDAVRCSRLRSVALYLWLIVVISVRQSTVTFNIWASLPGAGYGQFEHKADSLVQFKEAGGQSRDDVWAESPRLSPLWLSASSSAIWAVNHYRW